MKHIYKVLVAFFMAVGLMTFVPHNVSAATTSAISQEKNTELQIGIKKVSLAYTKATYNGKNRKPKVTIVDKNGTVVASKYYSVNYSDNVNVGTATVRIKLKGKYTGTYTKNFKILPPKTSFSKIEELSTTSVKLSWTKKTEMVDGYKIQYGLNNNFNDDDTITLTIKNNNTSSKTIKHLGAALKYYYRIRTYKVTDGKKVWSDWSKVKSFKTSCKQSEVQKILMKLEKKYPEGMKWTNENSYYPWNGGYYSGGYGCAAFAFLFSDEAFGVNPAVIHNEYDNIRVGDVLRINGDTHSVVVLKIEGNIITLVEGNYNSSVHWRRTITKSELKQIGNYVMSRYPNCPKCKANVNLNIYDICKCSNCGYELHMNKYTMLPGSFALSYDPNASYNWWFF